ncbi:F-box protein CPR1-like [Papaver somniferum]|uniref:F-box protein CPR1-like n=1 Tax=Papaver somniferum TaxID=3469 RepID=UPI000E70557C|nr:F-box protein CPR1-like [Papaver somniferum]
MLSVTLDSCFNLQNDKKNNSLYRSVDYASILSALSSSVDYASILYDSSASRALSTSTCDGDIPMDYLIRDVLNKSRMLGTCNGLICMALNSSDDVFIWNPTTGEYKKVQSPFPTALCHSNRYGFYYDSIVHDYKLVRIIDNNDHFLVDVFTISSRSLKKIQSINHYKYPVFRDEHMILFRRHISAFFLNGALHWLGVNTHIKPGSLTRVIVSFDVGSERFVDILFPEDAEITNRDRVIDYVGVLEDCLSLCTYHIHIHRIDIWLMQEYGVTESWTKRFSFRTYDIFIDIYRLKPLWSFTNGELLIVTNGEDKLSYDPKNDSLRVFEIRNGNPGSNCGS